MRWTDVVLVAAAVAAAFAATTETPPTQKEKARVEAVYTMQEYAMACDSVEQARRYVHLVEKGDWEAERVVNSEAGVKACVLSKLRYNAFAPVEQVPDQYGVGTWQIIKVDWVTAYLPWDEENSDWIQMAPTDQYVVVFLKGSVI